MADTNLSSFAYAVLAGLGAPASNENINFLLAWFQREGTRAAFNPMATTLNYGSNTKFNSVGVRNYADFNTGVQATVRTLHGYPGIVADLVANNPQGAANNHPDEFKKWSGGGYDHLVVGNVGDTVGGLATSAGVNSTATGAPAAGKLPANATPAQVEQFIKENYPTQAAFLDIPEVRQVLNEAAQADAAGDPWSDAKLQAKISATNWYKNTGVATRSFLVTQKTDPATAEQMIQQKMADIKPQLDAIGSNVSLRAIAEAALTNGWDQAQIQANLAGHVTFDVAHTGLVPGSVPEVEATKLAQIATSEYFIPVDTQTAQTWAAKIYAGTATEDSFREYLANMAEARFPGLKAQGITPGLYMSPIQNAIAQTLEVPVGEVNLLDPKYSAVLQVQGDKGTRPMTIGEAQDWARKQPGYLTTKNALDTASGFAETLSKTFGMVAG